MSRLESIVPPFELCKQIPVGEFEDSALKRWFKVKGIAVERWQNLEHSKLNLTRLTLWKFAGLHASIRIAFTMRRTAVRATRKASLLIKMVASIREIKNLYKSDFYRYCHEKL